MAKMNAYCRQHMKDGSIVRCRILHIRHKAAVPPTCMGAMRSC